MSVLCCEYNFCSKKGIYFHNIHKEYYCDEHIDYFTYNVINRNDINKMRDIYSILNNKYENSFLLLDKLLDLIHYYKDDYINVENILNNINNYFGELFNYSISDITYDKTTSLSFILTLICIFKDNNLDKNTLKNFIEKYKEFYIIK